MVVTTLAELASRDRVCQLFSCHEYLRPLLEDCFARRTGRVWLNSVQRPVVALLEATVSFLGGSASHRQVPELASVIAPGQQVLVPNDAWATALSRQWGSGCRTISYFSFTDWVGSVSYLRDLQTAIPTGFSLNIIGASSLPGARQLAPEMLRYFRDPREFRTRGRAFCVLRRRRVVSLASTLIVCGRKAELLVATQPQFRGLGLATAAAAALLAWCQQESIAPSWHAENEASKQLAQKLGFRCPYLFNAYYHLGENLRQPLAIAHQPPPGGFAYRHTDADYWPRVGRRKGMDRA